MSSGCSSARLEYTSGGRVAAGSNPVTPTAKSDESRSFFVPSPFSNLKRQNPLLQVKHSALWTNFLHFYSDGSTGFFKVNPPLLRSTVSHPFANRLLF